MKINIKITKAIPIRIIRKITIFVLLKYLKKVLELFAHPVFFLLLITNSELLVPVFLSLKYKGKIMFLYLYIWVFLLMYEKLILLISSLRFKNEFLIFSDRIAFCFGVLIFLINIRYPVF